MRIALAERTRHRVIVPNDLQMELRFRDPRTRTAPSTPAPAIPRRASPADEQLPQAAEVLNAGERVAMLAGAGALHATDEVIEIADVLGAGVAKALLGKAASLTTCRSSPARSGCSAPGRAGT